MAATTDDWVPFVGSNEDANWCGITFGRESATEAARSAEKVITAALA